MQLEAFSQEGISVYPSFLCPISNIINPYSTRETRPGSLNE